MQATSNPQATPFDLAELARVMRNQDCIDGHGVRGDQCVECACGLASPRELRAHGAVLHRCILVECGDLERQRELAQGVMRILGAIAPVRAECELPERDGGNPDLTNRLAAKLLERSRMLLDDRDAGIGIEHPLHSNESRCSASHGRC